MRPPVKYTKTYSYNILRPFRYSKTKTGFLTLGLALTAIFSPILLYGFLNVHFYITFLVFIVLYIAVSIIESKFLFKTEIVDKLIIDKNSIKTSDQFFEFNNIKKLKFKNYIHPYKSWVARWKFCYILSITLNDDTNYHYLISKRYPPLTPEIADLLEEIKHSNKEYYRKFKLTN